MMLRFKISEIFKWNGKRDLYVDLTHWIYQICQERSALNSRKYDNSKTAIFTKKCWEGEQSVSACHKFPHVENVNFKLLYFFQFAIELHETSHFC